MNVPRQQQSRTPCTQAAQITQHRGYAAVGKNEDQCAPGKEEAECVGFRSQSLEAGRPAILGDQGRGAGQAAHVVKEIHPSTASLVASTPCDG